MKKKNYLGIILAFTTALFNNNSYSQAVCQTINTNPLPEFVFNDHVSEFKAQGRHLNTDLKIIPTVIHVIYRNLADRLQVNRAVIQGQIEITNKQLRRLNTNAIDTRPEFLPVAADCNIQLALATRKPDRRRFDGVIYHYYPNYVSSDLNAIRAFTMLDPRRYLNVWVMPNDSTARAIFPWDRTPITDSLGRDGFCIGSLIFGIKYPNLPLQNGGATFTHELGHYLGVLHTFDRGNGYPGSCDRKYDSTISDYCGDTPLDWNEPFGIPPVCKDPHEEQCEAYYTQNENYMYYNPDRCLNMFSKDQRARMRACLGGLRYRYTLSSFSNLLFTGVRWTDLRGNNSYSQLSEMPDGIIDNDLTPGKSLSKNDISIFPNPAKSNVYLTYRNPAIKNMTLKVYNQTGVKLKEIYSKTSVYELNLDGLPDGIYYINMTIDNMPVTKRIIKAGSGGVSSAQ